MQACRKDTAFAAEFLLPRKVAENAVRKHSSLQEAAHYLQSEYHVNTELLAWQINNSLARMSLDQEELVLLEQWQTGRAELE